MKTWFYPIRFVADDDREFLDRVLHVLHPPDSIFDLHFEIHPKEEKNSIDFEKFE
jgi:hypothetical protein